MGMWTEISGFRMYILQRNHNKTLSVLLHSPILKSIFKSEKWREKRGSCGQKCNLEVGFSSGLFYCTVPVLSHPSGALVIVFSFLQLTPNCSGFSLAIDLPLALYLNRNFVGYLPSSSNKPIKIRYRLAAMDFTQANSTCISKEALSFRRNE